MILGDLGADVIKIEPPGGNAGRYQGPRLDDADLPESERSLQFAAYNRNKRSIVLDPDSVTDRGMLLAMAVGADFILDSGPPGNLAQYGIGFAELRGVNPQVVHVHISPWGADGPAVDRPATDLTLSAMGGQAALQGSPDRAPVRVTVPQVWRHAGAEAAAAALIAHARMRVTGEAQFVDLSAQCAVTWTTMNAMDAWAVQGFDYQRMGSTVQLGISEVDPVFACQDGYLVALPVGSIVDALLGYFVSEEIVDERWVTEDWGTIDARRSAGEEVAFTREEIRAAFARYFAGHTKAELFQLGLELGITLAPINTTADLLKFEQLTARNAWTPVLLANGATVRAPGRFAWPSGHELEIRRPAPRLNEHGAELRTELQTRQPRRASVQVKPNASGRPFEGLKVLDLTWVIAGPASVRQLCDHGATVVKVESELRPDGLRFLGPHRGEMSWNNSHFYGDFNAGKQCVQLNLKVPEAVEILKKLIAWADVLVENWAPGAMDRLGLSYAVCKDINPGIIVMSTSLMGQTGPVAALAGFGYHAGGMAGFYEVTGWPDLQPHGPWLAYTDVIAPRFIAALIAASLDHRERTGAGQHIDAAQFEIALQFLAPEIMDTQTSGYVATRLGNRARDAAPQGIYPCAGDDQWCAIACESDAHWLALRAALDEPEWARAAELNQTAGRLMAHDEIDAGIAAWTRLRTPQQAMDQLAAHGVPAGAVQRSEDLAKDPQYLHRQFHRFHDHPEMGNVPYAGVQYRIPGYQPGPYRPAPMLGEHTISVLRDDLGMSETEIQAARSAGALQ
jgi:crotonobetainyl-CoA:carnitine CoA-transferase CaiB-like acyl-CoA transferase